MKNLLLIPLAAALLGGPALAQDDAKQAEYRAAYERKLAKAFIPFGGWITDYDAAREKAHTEGKLLFTYFSRSSPPLGAYNALEGSALSDPNFPAFAATIVPFLHITTGITDHPYANLPREKGIGGLPGTPSLVFMDADGEVLGQPKGLSVESFAATADALVRIEAATADAEAGVAHAATELLLLEYALGRYTEDEFRTRAGALGDDPSEAQAATINQTLVDIDAWGFIKQGPPHDAEAGLPGLLQMLADGRTPSPGGRLATKFWTMIGDSAKASGDAALLRTVAAGIRTSFPSGDRYMTDTAKRYEEIAKGLDDRDALAKRKAAGVTGLEAQILLIEGRLRVTSLESFSASLADALKVATEAEANELRQLERDIEVEELVDQWSKLGMFGNDEERGKISGRLLAMATALDPAPSDRAMTLAYFPLYSWAMGQDDADAVERHADTMEARGGEGSALANIAGAFRELAAKKRKEG